MVGTSGSVTSTFNSVTGVWQAVGNKDDVNILAGLIFRPVANVNKGFSVGVSIVDGYGQSLSSTMGAIGLAVNGAPAVNLLYLLDKLVVVQRLALVRRIALRLYEWFY